MRVCWLFEYPTLNGGERSTLATLPSLRAAGVEPVALAPPEGGLARALTAAGVPVQSLTTHAPGGARLDQAARRLHLAASLRALAPDLLHANSLAMSRLSGPVAADLGLPSLGHVRDIMKLSRRALADVSRHTRVACVSTATRDYHVARGLDAARSVVLFNGVDLDAFRPRPRDGRLHAELGLDPAARLIGAIGQVGRRKGQDVLLAAAAALAPDVHVVVVGERNSDKDEARAFEAELHAQAAATLPGRVHWLGRRTDVADLLPELYALAHAARQEPLGRVLLEAAACGLPVVATRVGGTAEIFPAGEARLVEVDDPAALGHALGEVLADAALTARLGAASRARAESAFDARVASANLTALYRQVVA